MNWLIQNLWLIPALPLLAAGASALLKRSSRTEAASLAIGAMVLAFFLSCTAFVQTLGAHGAEVPPVHNFDWFVLGETTLRLGWVLDPLTAAMLVMVTFVGTLIFIYSVGYMAHDANFARFFCFLSLFAAAMLVLIIANSLLLLFMGWEVVGLASYLLIGFWFEKPSAAAAAKKAFITTRLGDVFLLIGILWLSSETGTLLFYDGGAGCLEQSALAKLVAQSTWIGMGVSTAIALLIFCGAIGKSGQVPLHVWLPDAMEGPTPVSALIHAATMVAAGVFLVARVFPLMAGGAEMVGGHVSHTTALTVVTWVGAITALFAALVAVAQTDIKRILAYSTVSQLGFMMMGLGTGGVAVGMFHLLTHAFFKALLFLGAGSVIHGCHEEQDIRQMGGLRKLMPVTFVTYAVGMMALSGVPLFFSGFWSKDEILHAAWVSSADKWPFVLGLCGAFLTAFYMTRQMWFVFFGEHASAAVPSRSMSDALETHDSSDALPAHGHAAAGDSRAPHEGPSVMTIPLAVLASCTVLLSVFGTPVWPWFHSYLSGHGTPQVSKVIAVDSVVIMLVSAAISLGGIGLAWWFYSRRASRSAGALDPLEELQPGLFATLRGKFFIDELYEISFIRWNAWAARAARWLDDSVWRSGVTAVSQFVLLFSWASRFADEFLINLGFDQGCGGTRSAASFLSRWQNGQVQRYLRILALALAAFGVVLFWGGR